MRFLTLKLSSTPHALLQPPMPRNVLISFVESRSMFDAEDIGCGSSGRRTLPSGAIKHFLGDGMTTALLFLTGFWRLFFERSLDGDSWIGEEIEIFSD